MRRCLFGNCTAEDLLLKDAKSTAMEIGILSLHGPGEPWGLYYCLTHGLSKVIVLFCSLSGYIIPFIKLCLLLYQTLPSRSLEVHH